MGCGDLLPDTPYFAASSTKLYLRAILIQLADEGRIALDETLAQHMPDTHDLTPEQEGYEECVDGNEAIGDGCSDTCLREVCGNGRVDQGEAGYEASVYGTSDQTLRQVENPLEGCAGAKPQRMSSDL